MAKLTPARLERHLFGAPDIVRETIAGLPFNVSIVCNECPRDDKRWNYFVTPAGAACQTDRVTAENPR